MCEGGGRGGVRGVCVCVGGGGVAQTEGKVRREILFDKSFTKAATHAGQGQDLFFLLLRGETFFFFFCFRLTT